jgi:hypothetical protein
MMPWDMKKGDDKSDGSSRFGKHRWFVVMLVVAAAAVSLPSITGGFLNWDDDRFIVNNRDVSSLTIDHLRSAFGGLNFESYQPLHLVSYMVDGSLWSGRAPLYRLHNVLLYIAGILMVYAFLCRIGFSPKSSFLGTLFFALAPYRVESVAWISARKDVLMLVFLFAAWHLRLLADDRPSHRKKLTIASLLCFVLALLSKSSALVFPAMMLAVDIGIRQIPSRRAVVSSLIYLVPAAAIAIALPFIWSDASLIQESTRDFTSRVALVGWTLYRYCRTVIWPFSTSPLYAEPDAHAMELGAIFAAFIIATFAAITIGRIRKKLPCRRFVTASGLFVIGLLPFLNFIPLYYFQADRYLLLPSIGLALGAAAIVEAASRPKKSQLPVYLLAAFIIAMDVSSLRESYHWRDSVHLWRHAVSREPDAYFARLKFGETLRGLDRFEESAGQYRAALSIKPLAPSAVGGLFWGSLLQDMGEVGPMDGALAEKLSFYFVSIANDGAKLESLLTYLGRQRWSRAAAVVRERFQE